MKIFKSKVFYTVLVVIFTLLLAATLIIRFAVPASTPRFSRNGSQNYQGYTRPSGFSNDNADFDPQNIPDASFPDSSEPDSTGERQGRQNRNWNRDPSDQNQNRQRGKRDRSSTSESGRSEERRVGIRTGKHIR